MPPRTIAVINTKLWKAYKPIDDVLVHSLIRVSEGETPQPISRSHAEFLVKQFSELEDNILLTLTSHAAFVVAIEKAGDLIEEYALDQIDEKVFKEQKASLDEVFKLIKVLYNYYRNHEQTNQTGVDKANPGVLADPGVSA